MQTPKGEINDKIMELVNDEEILQKMSAAGSPEACYDLVKERLGISFEEFQSSMSVAMSYVNEMKTGELSEDDLDAVAGGKSTAKIIGSVFGAVGATAGVAGAAIGATVAALTSAMATAAI